MLFLNFTNFYDNKINTKSLLELSVGQKKKKTNKQTTKSMLQVSAGVICGIIVN